jgi:hypothetical protein
MAAQVERSLNSVAGPHAAQRTFTVLDGCLAVLVVTIGVVGLGASRSRRVLESWIDIHALFGVLLGGLVLVRYRWYLSRTTRMEPAQARELSGHLSRVVYLSLYLVIGVKEVTGILDSLWHGGPVDFNLFDQRFHSESRYLGFDPKDDLQLLFAAGLVALGFARALVYRLWSSSLRDARPPRHPSGRLK